MGIGTFEPASRWWAARVEAHSHLMNGDVVVVPTQGHQVVRVVITPVGSGPDVMRLDPVATLTAIDLTSARSRWRTKLRTAGGMASPGSETPIGRLSSPQTMTRTLPVQRISERVLGPTLGPDDSVTPASPKLEAGMAASTKTSATDTARPVSESSPLVVSESMHSEARASTRR